MYGVERLKTTCEQILQKGLNVENAAGLLALADENRWVGWCLSLHAARITHPPHINHLHRAASLKETCTRFIIKHFDRATKSEGFASLSRDLILEVLQSR